MYLPRAFQMFCLMQVLAVEQRQKLGVLPEVLPGEFDQPSNAVVAADGLVYRVMAEHGYPMESFEAQARLISVDHPSVVENYRFAHRVRERVESEQASTEDMRGALLRYRSLFDELRTAIEAGQLRPIVSTVLTRAGRTHRLLEGGHVRGKLVLSIRT